MGTNTHNKTHPLIKFNLPVRHVSVTTHGEGANGQQMPVMGDHIQRAPEAAQPAPQSPSKLSAPRTVVDTKPQPPSPKISLSAGFEKEQQKKNLARKWGLLSSFVLPRDPARRSRSGVSPLLPVTCLVTVCGVRSRFARCLLLPLLLLLPPFKMKSSPS